MEKANVLSEIQCFHINEIIRNVFGTSCKIRDYIILLRREDYFVLQIELVSPNHKVIVKLAGPKAELACPFETTLEICNIIKSKSNIPIPTVYAADETYSMSPWRYIIYLYMPGNTLLKVKDSLDTSDMLQIYSNLGGIIGKLHNILFDSFSINPFKPGTNDSLLDTLRERIILRIKKEYHNFIFEVLENNRKLFEQISTPCLTHDDLNPNNILVVANGGNWNVSGIIDFDSCWAGCFESDLARLELWGIANELFFREYNLINTRVTDSYIQRKPIYQLIWCLEYASPTVKHNNDTKLLCEKLGVPIIQFN